MKAETINKSEHTINHLPILIICRDSYLNNRITTVVIRVRQTSGLIRDMRRIL